MGTSLSGLTPATTFDGLLKTSDNEPLDGTLKAISTGDGTDTILSLSNSALSIGGDVTIKGTTSDDTANSLLIQRLDGTDLFQVRNDRNIYFGSTQYIRNGYRFYGDWEAYGVWDFNSDVNIGTGTGIANTRLLVKGSGATSATTSLLVQNSAGTNIFKVVDDNTMFYHTHKFRSAGGYLYIEGEGNADRSLRVGQNFTASSYDGHIFKTYDGAAYSEAMRITGANDQFVGIGETTPTAKLHVKGSGNDNTTTSLLVQNSDGTDGLYVKDALEWGIGYGNNNKIHGNNNNLYIRHNQLFFMSGGSYFAKLTTAGFQVGNGAATATARLQVKGSGATSATTALLVQNSAGTEHLKVTDDGEVNVRQSLYVNHSSVSSRSLRLGWGSIYATDNSSELILGAVYSQTTAPRIHLGGKTRASGADAIQVQTLNGMYIATTAYNEDPSAQLQVKGSGNDATTTALLVQNSDTTPLDLFKILDDGTLVAPNLPTSATGLPTGAIYNDAGTLKIV